MLISFFVPFLFLATLQSECMLLLQSEEDVFQITRLFRETGLFPKTRFKEGLRWKQMPPLWQYPLTFSQLGIIKAHSDLGFFTGKLWDDSRNLTNKQMFFPSRAFLNEMVAWKPDHNNNFSIFSLYSDSVCKIIKSEHTN